MLLIYNQAQMVMRQILDIKVFVSKCFATDVTCITQRPIQSGCALRARDGMAGIGGQQQPPPEYSGEGDALRSIAPR